MGTLASHQLSAFMQINVEARFVWIRAKLLMKTYASYHQIYARNLCFEIYAPVFMLLVLLCSR